MSLILRPPRHDDETVARRLHAELLQDGFTFLLADGDWAEVLETFRREAQGDDIPRGRARADFLLAEVDGVVVGRVSIRHSLNDHLREVGGHVGYAVAPEHRRRGYATRILQLSVARLADLGVERVLVTCGDDNVGSAAVVEACGGVLEDVRTAEDGVRTRRYRIQARA